MTTLGSEPGRYAPPDNFFSRRFCPRSGHGVQPGQRQGPRPRRPKSGAGRRAPARPAPVARLLAVCRRSRCHPAASASGHHASAVCQPTAPEGGRPDPDVFHALLGAGGEMSERADRGRLGARDGSVTPPSLSPGCSFLITRRMRKQPKSGCRAPAPDIGLRHATTTAPGGTAERRRRSRESPAEPWTTPAHPSADDWNTPTLRESDRCFHSGSTRLLL